MRLKASKQPKGCLKMTKVNCLRFMIKFTKVVDKRNKLTNVDKVDDYFD